jgi:hypothetical protein
MVADAGLWEPGRTMMKKVEQVVKFARRELQSDLDVEPDVEVEQRGHGDRSCRTRIPYLSPTDQLICTTLSSGARRLLD